MKLYSSGAAGVSPASMNGSAPLSLNVVEALKRRNGSMFGGGEMPPLPGVISGFGGGTWNTDGTQATPVERGGFSVPMDGGPAMPEAAMPSMPVPPPAVPPVTRRGLFGRAPAGPSPVNAQANANLPAMARPTGAGFDYDAALAAMAPPEQKKGGFRGTLVDILQVLGPALMAAGGDTAGANAFTSRWAAEKEDRRRRQLEAQATIAKWQHDDWALKNGADLRASAPFTIGRERLQYDPTTGEVSSLYKGNAEFEDYAASQGLEPGTPDYFSAVEDYVLRGNGPSAMEYDQQLDDYRTSNRLKVVGAQQKGRERIRSMPTYRDKNAPPPRTAGPRASRQSARPTATGPNGQKVEWDGKAWVPVQ